jgi:hypothetical protein
MHIIFIPSPSIFIPKYCVIIIEAANINLNSLWLAHMIDRTWDVHTNNYSTDAVSGRKQVNKQ